MRRVATWPFLGITMGCVVESGEVALLSCPPTLSRPCLSMNGSSLWRLLLSLTRTFVRPFVKAFFRSWNCLSFPSSLLRVSISSLKQWCWMDLRIILSAWESSSTKGVPSLGRQLYSLFGLSLSIALCTWTIHRLRWLSVETCLKRSGSNIPDLVWKVLVL